MRTRLVVSSVTLAGLCMLIAGCASSFRRAEIPLGEWRGNGLFVVDAWKVGQQERQDKPPGTLGRMNLEHRTYPTYLKITPAPELGDRAVCIEILSEHGTTPPMEGDRTHLLLHLAPDTTAADDRITLYRLLNLKLSFDAQPPEPAGQPKGLTHASCLLSDGELVLQIHYMDHFVDTLRFRGNSVLKNGSYWEDGGEGLIHWAERLERCR